MVKIYRNTKPLKALLHSEYDGTFYFNIKKMLEISVTFLHYLCQLQQQSELFHVYTTFKHT